MKTVKKILPVTRIPKTTDYKMFRYVSYNRPIMPDHVRSLMNSYSQTKHLLPIVVNQECIVIDGQHRLEVAKKLGIPIEYTVRIVDHDDLYKVIAEIQNSRKWPTWQIIEMYANIYKEEKKQEFKWYPFFLDLMSQYNLNYTYIRSFFKKVKTEFNIDDSEVKISMSHIKRGTLCINQDIVDRTQFYLDLAQDLKSFIKDSEIVSQRSFSSAAATVVHYPEYEHEVMKRKMKLNVGKFQRCAVKNDYLKIFSDIYNYRIYNKNGKEVNFVSYHI